MRKLVIALTLLLLFSSAYANLTFSSFSGDFSSYNPAASGIPLNDIVTVANYYGCKTWVKNLCTECSQGYYFNKNGVCCEAPPLCSQFNRAEGICLSCYQGYTVVDNCCVLAEKDTGCATWNGNVCAKCSKGWFMSNGVCKPVSDQCHTWDSNNGNCLTCYNGYILSAGACIINPNPFNGGSNPLCAKWDKTACLTCAPRAYFNSFGICTAVSDQCQTWDPIDGSCLTCYGGYENKNGDCVKSAVQQPSDLGCSLWNTQSNICLKCSERFFFDGKKCSPVSDQCRTWNAAGACTGCYDGYDLLINGVCQLSKSNDAAPSDLGCATWDWKKQQCLKCSSNWVFNNLGVCVPVSDQCNTYDLSGLCVSCYKGYNLVAGKCILAPIESVADLGCAKWDWNNKVCLQCSNNWVFNNQGACVPVSDQCKAFDRSGNCVSCYDGYNLESGKCVLAPIQKPSDLGCATWDWKKQQCLKCSNNWVFNNLGVCVPVSDQCNTFDLSGLCVSCYDGYNLVAGKCVLAPIQNPTDAGCATWDWKKQQCLKCSNNWVFNNNGVCIPVSDQCKTFDLSGLCLSCYQGYNLVGGKCEKAPDQAPSDAGCGLWDWNRQQCLKCSNNWVFNNKGACIPVSDQCNTYDLSGLCLTCYKGYNLVAGKCVLAPIQQVSDAGCGTWDWDKQVCLQCSNRFVFNSQRVCVPVSDNCNQWNSSGACTSCYAGYILNGGACTQGNSLCQSSNSNGACTSCYTGYILDNGNCVPISKLANLALYYSQCCPERLATLSQSVGNSSPVPFQP
jgi:hypothetical protein